MNSIKLEFNKKLYNNSNKSSNNKMWPRLDMYDRELLNMFSAWSVAICTQQKDALLLYIYRCTNLTVFLSSRFFLYCKTDFKNTQFIHTAVVCCTIIFVNDYSAAYVHVKCYQVLPVRFEFCYVLKKCCLKEFLTLIKGSVVRF